MSPGIPLPKPELVRAIQEQELKSVSAVFQALADGVEDAASKPGLASLLKTLWGAEYEDERDARFINDRVHANIQKDATFSVVPRIYGGVTSADQLRRIADVADKYDVPMVKITGGQRIDLLGIKKEDLPKVWRDLGMPSGHAYAKVVPHLQDLRRHRFLPLRRGRQHRARHQDRAAVPGAGEPRQDEDGDGGLSAQLLGGAGQGCRRGRGRGRQVGDLRRRRGGSACAQGRPALRGGEP